jgi:hypothetical protein
MCNSAHIILRDFSHCYGFENWSSTTGEDHVLRLLQYIILWKKEPMWTYEGGSVYKCTEMERGEGRG